MASKGPRSKLDHESRARRQKALEAPKEPQRPKTHWDHVLEEMNWLSKDFESERKWKLAQAKKVAIRASKGTVDQATRGERRVKEGEQRLRKVALNISKDVKKFWTKIEKLVSYKHQLEIDEKKKKALDKQLEFLLGQTERYSTMLAENLVNAPTPCKPSTSQEAPSMPVGSGDNSKKTTSESDTGSQSTVPGGDEDYSLHSEDESVDDERTIEEDEALITKEDREEELAALQSEIDLPIEELLKRYAAQEDQNSIEKTLNKVDNVPGGAKLRECNGKSEDVAFVSKIEQTHSPATRPGRRCVESNGALSAPENHRSVVKTYKRRFSMKKLLESEKNRVLHDFTDELEDDDFVPSAMEEKDHGMDDETTLLEEEELANAESNSNVDEIALLHKESEIPMEELLARYKKDCETDEDVVLDPEEPPGESKAEDDESSQFNPSLEEEDGDDIMADAAAAAKSAQPTGNTFSTTKVRTKFPFLIKYPLREYQHIGLDWLVTMYEKRLNGILADEMGLGKTIMTIALLAHLACEKGIWGPHLIVVPTSVMLNWETEFLKWCPAFKILTYFGSAKERKMKRQGWLKPNSFHVCITTYRLVIQDSKVFKRKKWKYLILDEAHLIKNWKSQRWQTLLNFNAKRRILLTGTPLQNDLMELWSLMHFLMPHVFQSHQEFKDWFSNPISVMVDGQEKVNKEVLDRLHNVLRPFILRRLKRDVEKQLPMKVEHVITCRLSRRQRNLYEDFIASSETQATLASSNFFGMISVIMQLRKVCNHPDLFEGRPIVSSYDMSGMDIQLSSAVCSMLSTGPFSTVDLIGLGFVFTHLDFFMTSWEDEEVQSIATPSSLIEQRVSLVNSEENKRKKNLQTTSIFEEIQKALLEERLREVKERATAVAWWNSLRCKKKPVYSTGLRELVTVKHPVYDIHSHKENCLSYEYSSKLADIVLSPVERFNTLSDHVESFMFAIPAARVPPPACWCSNGGGSTVFIPQTYKDRFAQVFSPLLTPFRPAIVRRQVYFPDRRLIQFDCGKLQELAILLRRLKSEGHRALIFTQMTKMLDILEAFINLYGYTYMRLDGSTQPEERQTLMQRFNTNPKIFLFILSTRSGGVGINLVGADTVIFYDSDWNPAMDQQAQDRCHRIGQTREVHIYRLITESTIEENILKKANQKRALDNLVIQSGSYNTDFFKKLDPMELFSGHGANVLQTEKTSNNVTLSSADLEAALKNAEDEADYMALKKVEEEEAVDNQEFTEEKVEDDELLEEDLKPDGGPSEHVTKSDEGNVVASTSHYPVEERAHTLPVQDDDVDTLAVAAAAAGQAIVSFESQLRPIDRYAIRFLELWDPIVDKAAVGSDFQIEEKEWELERIEKLKDEMEAEIDDDDEPLVYESWDADFATQVYRQQVETLAQHQLMEDLEREAQEKEALEHANSDSLWNDMSVAPKPKSKKKTKKSKFRSVKKVSKPVVVKEETSVESMSIDDDDDIIDDDMIMSSPCSTQVRKRKPISDDVIEQTSRKKSKKSKSLELGGRTLTYSESPIKHQNQHKDSRISVNGTVVDLESKQITNRSKTPGKLSIPVAPLKQVFTIKVDKLKRKGNIWSKDYFPFPPDHWAPREDAVLCAAVHEFGPNWFLTSEILSGIVGGGSYRGRYRHPVHCCERFRELIQRHVLSVGDASNNDKVVNIGSAKALLKVTEDNIHELLEIASELPDEEPLVQKHYFAVLTSSWRRDLLRRNNALKYTPDGFYSFSELLSSTINQSRKSSKDLEFSGLQKELVSAALRGDLNSQTTDKGSTVSNETVVELYARKEELDLTLELPGEPPLPSIVHVSILGPDPPHPFMKTNASGNHQHFKSSQSRLENRFRSASEATVSYADGGGSLGFLTPRSRTQSVRSFGKHKLNVIDSPKQPISKSILKRSSIDCNDLHSPTSSSHILSQQPIPTYSAGMRFDDLSSEACNFENESIWLPRDIDDDVESFPFTSGPDVTSVLDDWSMLDEFFV